MSPTSRTDRRPRITSIKPSTAYPGSAIIVHHQPLDPSVLAEPYVEIAKQPAEVLVRGAEYLVIRVPVEAEPGHAKVRLFHGDRRSKPRDVRLKPRRLRRFLRNLVGGLALFIFGLRTLSSGLRRLAGSPLRSAIGGMTRGSIRGLGFGALAGGVGQSVASAVALVLGLLQSRLLTFETALVVLLGAHLGAGVAILVLPLGISRESLWLVAIGTVLITLVRRGRGESLGKMMLGIGLLLHGLSVLRAGFEPFMGDPDMLSHVQALRGEGVLGAGLRVMGGTVAGALLQTPGAVFGIVLGIGESTALLSPEQALQVLAGSNIGMSLGTIALALPFGRAARRLALAHLGLSVASSLAFLLFIGAALSFSGAVLSTDPTALDYGKKVLAPHLAEHLTLAYMGAQIASILLVVPLARPLSQLLVRVMPERRRLGRGERASERRAPDHGGEAGDVLSQVLEAGRATMTVAFDAMRTGERQPIRAAGRAIATARGRLKDAVAELVASGAEAGRIELLACVTALRMQQSLEQLLQLGERGLEKDYRVEALALEAFTELHEQVDEGLRRVIRHVEGREPIDLEAARAQEIEINIREAELRQRLLASFPDHVGRERDVLWWTEVVGAYEGLGNHVYRLAEAFGDVAADL